MLKNRQSVILKSTQLHRFSTESHFPWQLDVERFSQ